MQLITASPFSMVRFGNVLGSSGSVVPLFVVDRRWRTDHTYPPGNYSIFLTISEAASSFCRPRPLTGGDVFLLIWVNQ